MSTLSLRLPESLHKHIRIEDDARRTHYGIIDDTRFGSMAGKARKGLGNESLTFPTCQKEANSFKFTSRH